jgi:CheY-like chemotaxis protein
MQKSGPILVIEDDCKDQENLEKAFTFLNFPNQVIFFSDGYEALDFIEKTDTKPFLILSDIRMPKIDGFELRKKIQNNKELNIRCIPYLFFTTGAHRNAVYDAYAMSAQGFFIKPKSITDLQNTLKKMVEYWLECFSPDQYIDSPSYMDLRTPVERNKKN